MATRVAAASLVDNAAAVAAVAVVIANSKYRTERGSAGSMSD